MEIKYKYSQIGGTKEQLHSCSYTFILKPVILSLTWFFANFTKFTPNQISFLSLFPAILCGLFFFKGMLILGSIMWLVFYLLDTVDGRIARLKGIGSKFGGFFDNYIDEWRRVFVIVGLFLGLAILKDNYWWLVLGIFVYFVFGLHDRFSLQAKSLIGMDYKSLVKEKHKKIGKQSFIWRFFSRIITYLTKKGAAEPFHTSDIRFIVFFVGPIIETFYGGVLIIIIFISLTILLIKEVFWFDYYKRILKECEK